MKVYQLSEFRTVTVKKQQGQLTVITVLPRHRGTILQGVSVAASPVLATIGMSVCPSVRLSVRHTLALSENDAS